MDGENHINTTDTAREANDTEEAQSRSTHKHTQQRALCVLHERGRADNTEKDRDG